MKGFHRGHRTLRPAPLREPEAAEKLQRLGLIVVEGPNDVIRLDTLGVPAVGLCSNTITREQAAKAAQLARELAGGVVTVFLDCDAEGENGMKQCLGYLAQLDAGAAGVDEQDVRRQVQGRQPESLTASRSGRRSKRTCRVGKVEGWSLE